MMKVSVVGGGPAGSIAALRAAAENEVTVYEQRKTPKVQCAGLVSKSGLSRLGIRPGDSALNTVSSAKIFPPSGKPFLVRGREEKAYVLDRKIFDSMLLGMAADAGAELACRRAIDLSTLPGDRVILASGSDYTLHRRFGLSFPKKFLVGAQYELKVECDPETVELHFNVPEFFSWIIPAGDLVRVGCCTLKNPTPHLDSFIKKLLSEGRVKGEIVDRNYGMIPLYEPRMRTQYGRIALLGDAAGQVKASTGGGIVVGGLAAAHACDPDYETSWRKELGRELSTHMFIHRFLSKLSDKRKDIFFSIVAEHTSFLEKEGDMDRATSTLSMFKDPGFTLRFAAALPGFILDLF